MWEGLHLLFRDTTHFPVAYPRPRLDVGDRVLALTLASQIFSRLVGILAGKTDLEHPEDTQGLVAKPTDRI